VNLFCCPPTKDRPPVIVGKPARLYAAFWRWHFLAALIVIPFGLWQSTTGTLYLWSEWWMDVRHPELRFVPVSNAAVLPSQQSNAAFQAISADAIQARAASLSEGHEHHGVSVRALGQPVLQIVLPEDPRRSTAVVMQGSDGLPIRCLSIPTRVACSAR
jgi:uncharacterized iron-regulated membrane protein